MTGQPMDPTTPSPWASDDTQFVTAEPAAQAPTPAPAVPVHVPAPAIAADESWPTREMMRGRRGRFRHAAPPEPAKPGHRTGRRPALSLAAVVLLAMLAAFFAWVTAEPLWLAIGHGDTGTATVTQCVGGGVAQRCVGDFTGSDGTLVERVTLLGVGGARTGGAITARMVDATSGQAYVGAALHGLHLRWLVGLALTMLCGVGIALATGAVRMTDRHSRRVALATSLGAPVLLMIGFLVATF